MLNYEFTEPWIVETDDILDVMAKTDRNFPRVMVIVKESLDGSDVFLGFKDYQKRTDGSLPVEKKDFIFKTTKIERDYLNKVFDEGFGEIRFSASDGNYELYFPHFKDGKKIVLYFSDSQRYGKFGS